MEVAAEARVGPEGQQGLIHIPWLHRGEAQAGEVGPGQNGRDEARQPVLQPQVAAVGADVDAGQDGLLIPLRDPRGDLRDHLFRGAAAHRAAQDVDDAIGTGVLAAVLDFDEGAGAPSHPHLPPPPPPLGGRREGGEGGGGEGFRCPFLLRVGDDPGDVGEGGQFVGPEGGRAAQNSDAGPGVGPGQRPQQMTGLPLRLGGNRAGVDDADVGPGGVIHHMVALRDQLAGQRLQFALIQPTTQAVQVERRHRNSPWTGQALPEVPLLTPARRSG